MIKLHFEKTYNNDRKREHIYFGIPFKKGVLTTVRGSITDMGGAVYPSDLRPTAYWDDGSIRWLFVRGMVDLPENAGVDYYFDTDQDERGDFSPVTVSGNCIETGSLKVFLSEEENRIFDSISFMGREYDSSCISHPILTDTEGILYDFKIDRWHIKEDSPICTVITGEGSHINGGQSVYKARVNLTFYAEKDWFELGYQIINTTDKPLGIKSLVIQHRHHKKSTRNTVAISNRQTKFLTGERVEKVIDADYLQYDANEHNAEVFYGVFFADSADDDSGLCATVFQAQQNFPKALCADENGFLVKLVPENVVDIVMESGMAREQKILFHFHGNEDLQSLNNRSTIYEMPDRPAISPQVFRESGVFEDIFCDKTDFGIEIFLTGKADEHARCYGILHWGDAPDMGYTNQGRGKGELVWTNNEYDYPHACALMYARTGIRRYMDYVLVSGRHWMDVDICHYSEDPLQLNGQWEHTNGHCKNGVIACSHQWVEGLLDYYHLTGDIEAYHAAIGIGENVIRLLETPVFQKSGQVSARETGWALRTLVALYTETNEAHWLEKCDWIVGHFREWKEEYGLWLSPYMDNVAIRVVFMIAVAVCSLMRYYRINKDAAIRDMILAAVDDLVENARLDNGLFYYKELPSLQRMGNNPIILEALAIAYELTGDKKYLAAGIPTFQYIMTFKASGSSGGKKVVKDTVLNGTAGTKSFAQMFIPFAAFYSACVRAGLM